MKSVFKLLLLPIWCATLGSAVAREPMKVIFDTDMGNDVDDVIALDMLYKYQDAGEIDMLGIISSKRKQSSVEFIDVMNTLYGYPNIPTALPYDYPEENFVDTSKPFNYADHTLSQHNYPRTITDYGTVPDGYKLYRRLLSEAKDGEVTIIAVGFSTNLKRLIYSKGDEHSELDGKELMRRKVKQVVIMAGNFSERKKEYNVYKDHEAAVRFFAECPVPMLFTDFTIGRSILYPYQALYDSFSYMENHPALVAHEFYAKMPYNRPTWDPTAVLFAVEAGKGYASLSPRGYVTVDQGSVTDFIKDCKSNRRYYKVTDAQRMKIMRRIVELTTRRPKNFQEPTSLK
ncbi:MAG: nucleoside hydrolase [Alistipes sp.]|nr:nucleoside hydrolase [Alistipes sp.]